MKLQYITEDISSKVNRKAREALKGELGRIIKNPDELYDHLIKGTVSQEILLENQKWWKTLFTLLEPIDSDQLFEYYKATVDHITERLKDGTIFQSFDEGVVSGFLGLFKKVTSFIIQAIKTGIIGITKAGRGINKSMHNGGYGGGGYGGRGGSRGNGRNQNQHNMPKQKAKIATVNSMIVSHFMEQVISFTNKTNPKQTQRFGFQTPYKTSQVPKPQSALLSQNPQSGTPQVPKPVLSKEQYVENLYQKWLIKREPKLKEYFQKRYPHAAKKDQDMKDNLGYQNWLKAKKKELKNAFLKDTKI